LQRQARHLSRIDAIGRRVLDDDLDDEDRWPAGAIPGT
jgi:hypothetical protein